MFENNLKGRVFFTQISKAIVIEARIVNRLELLIRVDCGKLVVWL